MEGMNIMIPLGGIGSRFQKEGYPKPKPFCRVLGREMILWLVESLEIGPRDTVVVVYNPDFLDMKPMMEILTAAVRDIVLVELPRPTLGAAETVRFGLEGLESVEQRARPCMLVDGDTFYTCDIVGKYRAVSARAGGSFVFHDTQPVPMYSYVAIEGAQLGDFSIGDIVEKVKVSDWANTGCYCFRSGTQLLEYCAKIIDKGEMQLSQDQKGEFYTSGVIKAMLDDGHAFEAIVLERGDMHVLGTPAQVVDFCQSWPSPRAQRFCFELDGTLLERSGEPRPRVATALRRLHAMGHTVVLHTTRPRSSEARTVAALERAAIPYHELHFGKPDCDFYVDAKAVSTLHDLDKELGYYPPHLIKAVGGSSAEQSSQSSQSSQSQPPPPPAGVAPNSLLTLALGAWALVATGLLLRKRAA